MYGLFGKAVQSLRPLSVLHKLVWYMNKMGDPRSPSLPISLSARCLKDVCLWRLIVICLYNKSHRDDWISKICKCRSFQRFAIFSISCSNLIFSKQFFWQLSLFLQKQWFPKIFIHSKSNTGLEYSKSIWCGISDVAF